MTVQTPPNFRDVSITTCSDCTNYYSIHSQIEGEVCKKCLKYSIPITCNSICDSFDDGKPYWEANNKVVEK